MKVHIVAFEWESDQVLARLVQHLVKGAGWTVSGRPDPTADLNYFFPYILYAQQFANFNSTPTAAYFSHEDTENAQKREWWRVAAQGVDLRIVTAERYGHALKLYGATAYAHAPVDQTFFKVGTAPSDPRKTVGVSGFVYGDGRKGEKLVYALQKKLGSKVQFVAAGRGWAVPTRLYPWAELPAFYQRLDVYLCASTIEGVPLPPLEAMSCGVRCVIPAGVGMLDELGEHPDLYRFIPGSESSMEKALTAALNETRPVDQKGLRRLAAPWSVSAWVEDHLEAFNEEFNPQEAPLVPLSPAVCGAVYVAYGEPSRDCARIAIPAFKAQHPAIEVALISDEPLNVGEDVHIHFKDADIGGRAAKIKIYALTPQRWQYVLYMDADTEVIAPINFLYEVLADGWEMVICKNPDKYHTTRRMIRPDNGAEIDETLTLLGHDDFIQWNGGVFGFRRNARTEKLFLLWFREWDKYGARDQAALLRAMWQAPLRLYVLGNEWNTVTRYIDPDQSAGILHYPTTARRWAGSIPGRLDSPEAWGKVDRKNKKRN